MERGWNGWWSGIGLNVNGDVSSYLVNSESRDSDFLPGGPPPTSLQAELGEKVERGRLLAGLLVRLARYVPDIDVPEVLGRMRARDALFGRRLRVFAGPPDGTLVIAGEGAGIGPGGELLVRDSSDRVVPIVAGEVTLSVDR